MESFSLDELSDDEQQQLAGYAPEQFAVWRVRLNQLCWPPDFPLPPPAGWDATPRGRGRYLLAGPAYRYCRDHCGKEDFSRAWWTLVLGRSPEAWAAWWDTEGSTGLMMGE